MVEPTISALRLRAATRGMITFESTVDATFLDTPLRRAARTL